MGNRSNSLAKFYSKLLFIIGNKNLWISNLGNDCCGNPILYITNAPELDRYIRILIAGGFHGEEIAGPLAILEWIGTANMKEYRDIAISFIPIANPSAFDTGKRYNIHNEKSNCGFCHSELGDKLSYEGKILMNHRDRLIRASKHGFLSLHEDISLSSEYYVYVFENIMSFGKFTQNMVDAIRKFYKKPINGYYASQDDDRHFIVNGLAFNVCDGSFEDFLFHSGVSRCIVTETPAKSNIKKRINCNKFIIDTFIQTVKEIEEQNGKGE